MSAFTLTETLIVLALAAIFVNIGIGDGIAGYERGLSRTDRTLLVNALREVRAEAQNEVCTGAECGTAVYTASASHGVYVDASGITLFEGVSYALRTKTEDEEIPFSATERISGTQEIVFAAVSGDAASSSPSSTLGITGSDHHAETVSVSPEGEILPSAV